MNGRIPLLVIPLLLVGTCSLAAEAAEPSANRPHNQFSGKLVRVQMIGATRNEVFILENVRLTNLFGIEPFLIGTGVKGGPHQTSWCEGSEVHLNLHSVLSYMPMTPEQWKDKQPSAPTLVPDESNPPVRSAGAGATPLEGKIPSPPTTQPEGKIPPLPQPAAGPPLVPPQPEAAPNSVLPTQPNNPPAPPTAGIAPTQPHEDLTPAAGIAPTIDAQLKAAQDERVKLLSQIVEILTAQSKVGSADIAQVAAAENELCNALLDSTDEPEQRIALLTKQLDKANDFVKLMHFRFEAAGVGAVDLNRAKLLCLDEEYRQGRWRVRVAAKPVR